MLKTLLGIGIVLFGSYAAIMIFVYFTQSRMLYYPVKEIEATPLDIGLRYEEVTFRTRDGITISGWYIPAEGEKGVLLFCHGNAGNISHRLDSIKIFHDLGLGVLIFDYRGYGRSEGKPSEEGTYLDAEAAWDYLLEARGKPRDKIIVFGRSLGGAVATELALRKDPIGLIIESGFTSVPDLGRKFYPWLPVRLLSRFRYATLEKIGSIKCPKLIVHSPEDEIVPFAHGKAIYDKASPPKEILAISGDHNEGFLISGKKYTEGLHKFLQQLL